MKLKYLMLALGIALVIAVTHPINFIQTSIAGKIIRFLSGEPGATQDVNDAADLIIKNKWQSELEKLSDSLITEYLPQFHDLPKEKYGGGYLLPAGKIPAKYLMLGRMWSNPDLEIVMNEENTEPALLFCWGHGRHQMLIYQKEPKAKPTGFYFRQVGKRIFVGAHYS
jgi:hypothetical protein